jgi:hypothetical protein
VQFRLNRWLYALCWTGTDRPSVLFDRAVAWLLANKVVLPDERRIATLLAYIRTLEASAHDDVLDLFDVVVTDMFADAKAAGHKERLGYIRDLDAAALLLRQACTILLDESTPPDRAVRRTVFEIISARTWPRLSRR